MNEEVMLTLDEAVAEVLGLLTGLDLEYDPELDRYRAITRALNRALRANALEQEWSYYASTTSFGCISGCEQSVAFPSSIRPRVINDDAVRLVDPKTGAIIEWAYFLPRDALHKYANHDVLKCATTRQELLFNRPFRDWEQGLEIMVPVMREPVMLRFPEEPVINPLDISEEPLPKEQAFRLQPVDFNYPDVVIARAAYYYAQTDPVMQPRVQTLEGGYKDLMYQLIERDTAITDTPYTNEFILPLENGLVQQDTRHMHPHSNFI